MKEALEQIAKYTSVVQRLTHKDAAILAQAILQLMNKESMMSHPICWSCAISYVQMSKPYNRKDDIQRFTTLVGDMAINGQLMPVNVKCIGENVYEIVDGQKRLAAAMQLGWKTIKCKLVP